MRRALALAALLTTSGIGLGAAASSAQAGDSSKCVSNGRAWACMRVQATSTRVSYVSTYTGRIDTYDPVKQQIVPDNGPVTYRIVMLDKSNQIARTWPGPFNWYDRRPSQGPDNLCTWYEGGKSWTNHPRPCVDWPDGYRIAVEVNFAGPDNVRRSDAVTIQK